MSLSRPWQRTDWAISAAIALFALVRLGPDLAHHSIWNFDESFHVVVARHCHDTPLHPTLYNDPVHDSNDPFWGAREWLLKPPGSFWLGGFFMNFVGVEPLAWRLPGFLAEIAAALCLYWFGRRMMPRGFAAFGALSILCLPNAWIFTHGRFVGDVMDLTLMGLLSLALVAVVRGIELQDRFWFVAAGVLTGFAILVRSSLALTPLGVIAVLYVAGKLRRTQGPKFTHALLMFAVSLGVALPWFIYSSYKWPQKTLAGNSYVLVNLLGKSTYDAAPQWVRPVDGVFNELLAQMHGPVPNALMVVAALHLALTALRTRDLSRWVLSLWLWATWLGHSVAAVKVASHLWNAVVPGALALALLAWELWFSLPLAVGALAGVLTPWWLTKFPQLAAVREALPERLVQTKQQPGLAEGLAVVLPLMVLAAVASKLLPARLRHTLAALVAIPAMGLLFHVSLFEAAEQQNKHAATWAPTNDVAYTREIGRAIAKTTPEKSVLLFQIDRQPEYQLEQHNLMFWSNRLVLQAPSAGDYPQHGFTPYAVVPTSLPFVPVEAPAYAWYRAYDLTKPSTPETPLPPDAIRVEGELGALKLLGFGVEPTGRKTSHWAFFVKSLAGSVEPLTVTLLMKDGSPQKHVIPPDATLHHGGKFVRQAWFVLPLVGPPPEQVAEVRFGEDERLRHRF